MESQLSSAAPISRQTVQSTPWRVLIVNAWGGNRGDEAMLNTLNRLLHTVTPDVTVEVVPYRNEQLELDPDMHVLPGAIGEYWYARLPSVIQSRVRRRIAHKLTRAVTTALHVAGALPPRALFSGSDLVLSAPQGPTLGDMYRAKARIVAPLRRAQELGIPYMVLAISAGPFKGRSLSKRTVGRILGGAQRIVVREDVSLQHLRSTYPKLKNLGSAIDIVYALPCSLERKPRVTLERYQRFMADVPRDALGACISLTAARDPSHKFDRTQYIEKFLRLIDHALGESQSELLLFPHLEMDLPALQQIKSGSRYCERIKILPADFDSDFQRDAISKLRFFISSRYHPTIFAVQGQVPFLCVKNQFKVEGMLQKIGLGALPTCWQDEPADVLIRTFDACFRKQGALREQIVKASTAAADAAGIYRQVLEQAHAAWLAGRGDREKRSA